LLHIVCLDIFATRNLFNVNCCYNFAFFSRWIYLTSHHTKWQPICILITLLCFQCINNELLHIVCSNIFATRNLFNFNCCYNFAFSSRWIYLTTHHTKWQPICILVIELFLQCINSFGVLLLCSSSTRCPKQKLVQYWLMLGGYIHFNILVLNKHKYKKLKNYSS
jgi:hypothetical protein